MSGEYWNDTNTASTVVLSKEEDNGDVTKIHLTVFKDDTATSETTTDRRHFGILNSFDDSISSSVSVTPIVTYTAENAFAFDIQSNETLHLSFIRKNPYNKIKLLDESTGTLVEQQLPYDAGTDDRLWSNRKWAEELSAMINRWQVDTDGCVMTYEPLDPSLQLSISRNAYIKQLSYSMSTNSPEAITGSIEIQIGSMTANAIRSEDNLSFVSDSGNDKIYMAKNPDDEHRDENDKIMSVRMTSSDGLAEYIIFSGDVPVINGNENRKTLNCITSYTLKGGPEQPFEYLTMQISKKRLSIVAPNLVDDIIAGKNRIRIDAIGKGDFIVTKCSTSGGNYKVVAYTIDETYRSTTVGTYISFGADAQTVTPFGIIQTILSSNRDGAGDQLHPVTYTQNKILYAYRSSNNVWTQVENHNCEFNNNSSAWYVLSVCALRLGCKIWFSEGYVYVIDTSITGDMLSSPGIEENLRTYGHYTDIQNLYLNTSDPFPLSATPEEMRFPDSVCGTIQLGDEGAETVHNSIRVEFNSTMDDTRDPVELKNGGYSSGFTRTGVTRVWSNLENEWEYVVSLPQNSMVAVSQAKYGVKETVYKIPEIDNVDADAIAMIAAESNCDSEQSIGFKLKEMHKVTENGYTRKYWQRYFPQIVHVDTIYDYGNDLVNKNTSNFKYKIGDTGAISYHKMPNKLCLSTFEYNFPEGTTEYWFGIIKPTDVSQNSSEISNALFNQ